MEDLLQQTLPSQLNNMQKSILLLSMLVALFITTQKQTVAHVLEKEQTVGAVLHVSPNDDPVVGEVTDFFFEFKDTEGKFNPTLCICTVVIYENDKEVLKQDLFQSSTTPTLEEAIFSYVFPKKGLYTIKVLGESTDSSFEAFTLEYDIRVDREKSSIAETTDDTSVSWIKQHIVHIVGGILLGIFVIIVIIKEKIFDKKQNEKIEK